MVAFVGAASVAFAASPRHEISTAGVHLAVPPGWYARVATTPNCDPERLIVASSARLRVTAGGRFALARPGEVIVLLAEDRLAQDRPVGNLRRPNHFTVDWNRLRRLEPDGFCGNPRGPATMHYVEIRHRYLGFIVFPGAHPRASVRTRTLALMDSLRVTQR